MSYTPPPQDPNQQQQGYQQPPPGYQPPPQSYQPPTAPGQGFQQIQAGFQRFSLGRKVLLIAGLVSILLFVILPWYSVDLGLGGVGSVGPQGLAWVGLLLLIALEVAMALPLFGRQLRQVVPAIPLTEGQTALYGAGAAFGISLLGGFLSKPEFWSISFGFWLTMLALAATTAGGWLMFQARE